MRKTQLIIFLLSVYNLGFAKDLPVPGNANPCNPFPSHPDYCGDVPIDNFIPILIFLGLFLGIWMLNKKKNLLKT